MIIDILFFILLVLAVIKGISRGFVVAVFSFFAIIIGVAAAMKLSYLTASWLQQSFHTSGEWLPILSFLLVFSGVVILVRLVANFIQAAVKMAMLGWLNKLGGIVLYLFIYLFVYSILLFYLTKMNFIKEETVASSHTYALIEPFGPVAIDVLGAMIPVFKNIFEQLSGFFERIGQTSSDAFL
ncbi:CvpA family protein [Parafilimonas sp.]|uniref:CvpA family protein n=1 Tax=Parafilimonas sp. TaxID=1969739 RepID=UPI0039E4046F